MIYDSRVAAGLVILLVKSGLVPTYGSQFGCIRGRWGQGRTHPAFRSLSRGSTVTKEHPLAFQSFVFASWFCRVIAERLNERGVELPLGGPDDRWSAHHIEMVLFTLGKDLAEALGRDCASTYL